MYLRRVQEKRAGKIQRGVDILRGKVWQGAQLRVDRAAGELWGAQFEGRGKEAVRNAENVLKEAKKDRAAALKQAVGAHAAWVAPTATALYLRRKRKKER